MSELGKYRVLAVTACLMLFVSACGSSAEQETDISTAVAQTVQAGASLTELANQPTPTLKVTLPAETPVRAASPTSAPTLSSAPADPDCAKATLVGENPPDGVIMKPGQYFWKTWTLQNTGTCTWNPSYSLIFWSGDLMGGLTSYPLDDDIAPNEQKDISIYLKAPDTEGTFTGYWQLQSPWNANFGVGPSSEPFYVQVVTSNAAEPDYGIANVEYNLVRDPAAGCPTNVRYTLYVTVSSNGPVEADYFWSQSDGNNSHVKPIEFTEAGSQTLSREWMIGKGDSPSPRWIEFVITEPDYREYGKAEILNLCS
ncbi:MAG TPA: NBR1-Ig-like domain-containing protein [Anaerolineales bacterium]|nr:NBR1-Ig-like domain-containing protein [Anaerolineales bacterium]